MLPPAYGNKIPPVFERKQGGNGAGDRDRTGTDFTPRDFKSLVSACSTTPAYGSILSHCYPAIKSLTHHGREYCLPFNTRFHHDAFVAVFHSAPLLQVCCRHSAVSKGRTVRPPKAASKRWHLPPTWEGCPKSPD